MQTTENQQLKNLIKVKYLKRNFTLKLNNITGVRNPVIIKTQNMESKTNLFDPLLERAEAYSKSSFELLKLKTLEKTADVSSTLASRSLLTIVLAFFALTINIAIALWLGELMGKIYYGFLVVAACYALAGIVLLILHPFIKAGVNNVIIKQLFN